LYLTASGVTLPALNAIKSARPVCEEVRQILRPDDLVASYAFWNWRAEYRYYLGLPIENLFAVDALRAVWTGPRRVVLFVEDERLADARAVLGDAVPAIAEKVGGRSIYVFTSR
jgi:hypothetical protein